MSEARGKYLAVAERLSHRIRSGDYHVQGLPAERELATQVGVSCTTVRKALQRLVDQGLLYRQPNGRLAIAGNAEDGVHQKQVALLLPAWDTTEGNLWDITLSQLQDRFGYRSRMVHYVHWDDPVIPSTVRQFDATLLLPPDTPEIAPALLELEKPLVILSHDWSRLGCRSVRLMPPHFIQRLLDHLASLGHRTIDCINVQPTGSIIREWVDQWHLWRAANGIDGELINEPVSRGTNTLAAAYQLISRRIRDGKLKSTAMFCVTEAAAIGATRALLDNGIQPGRDIGIVTVGSERCEYLSPSLTTLEPPDPKPYLATALEWALSSQTQSWHGSLLIQPAELHVVVRESTVPDIDKSTTPLRVRRMEATSAPRRVAERPGQDGR